ncbi:MAG TPA: capsule assembly Wzi family protein [Longimicrobiales bacterium]
MAAAVLVTAALPARAQDAASAAAEPFAPHDHWSRAALRRLAAAGWVDAGAALAAWPLRRSRVRRLFSTAAVAAERRGAVAAARLARAYAERFDDEFPPPASAASAADPVAGRAAPAAERRAASAEGTASMPDRLYAALRVQGGLTAHENIMRGGASVWVEGVGWVYPGPVAVADASSGVAAAAMDLAFGGLAASVSGRWSAERLEAGESYLSLATGPLDLWLGRRGWSAGAAGRDAIVLAEGTLFDGGGLAIPEGFRLPGPLASLGPVRAAVMLARMERSGPYAHPLFWAARLSISPHRSLSIGFNRASLFGGEGNGRITPRTVLLMLLGFTDTEGKASAFENQVASVDLFWHTAAWGVPLALYGEWGFDDMGFAWTHVPGIVLGAELPLVPGVPALALGVERVHFDRSCCGNPPWYQHGPLAEGWTDRGRPLGHPLGGHGHATALRWRLDLPGTGILAGGRLFRRVRHEENLFAPARRGTSHGGTLRWRLPAARRAHLDGRLEVEHGRTGWWQWSARLATELTLGSR